MSENILNKATTIGTTPVLVGLSLQPGQRRLLALTNTSTGGQVISISWGKTASAGSGLVLYAGGTWVEAIGAGFIPSEMEVWAVSSLAGGTLAQMERVAGE